MRHLNLRRLRFRLGVFGALAVGFMAVVFAAERLVPTARPATWWVGIAGLLGMLSALSLVRWWSEAQELTQDDWQPALLLRVLGGALGFQAGLLGYFLAGDLTAAVVGCVLFLVGLAVASQLASRLQYEPADA